MGEGYSCPVPGLKKGLLFSVNANHETGHVEEGMLSSHENPKLLKPSWDHPKYYALTFSSRMQAILSLSFSIILMRSHTKH